MKVHLIRSPELSVETFSNVFNVLQQFPGPINFISGDSEDQIDIHMMRVWQTEEDLSQTKEFPGTSTIDPPNEEYFQSWEYFFDKCSEFREINGIRQRDPVKLYDHVFLLTDIGN